MEGKELYKMYAGRKASYLWNGETNTGTVVGYDEDSLIMAVEEGSSGWDLRWGLSPEEFIEDSWIDNKKGFLYVGVENILPREGKI